MLITQRPQIKVQCFICRVEPGRRRRGRDGGRRGRGEKKWTLNERVEGKYWMQQRRYNHMLDMSRVGLDGSGRGGVKLRKKQSIDYSRQIDLKETLYFFLNGFINFAAAKRYDVLCFTLTFTAMHAVAGIIFYYTLFPFS